MKKLLALAFVGVVILLGYTVYLDAQAKKKQELIKIINDAEHSLQVIEQNPNYTQHAALYSHNTDPNP